MDKIYFIKTRNWYHRKWVKKLLDISLIFGVYRGDNYNYNDGDGKYCFNTNSLFYGLIVLSFFKILAPLSGGWTYIYDNRKKLSLHEYKTFYI